MRPAHDLSRPVPREAVLPKRQSACVCAAVPCVCGWLHAFGLVQARFLKRPTWRPCKSLSESGSALSRTAPHRPSWRQPALCCVCSCGSTHHASVLRGWPEERVLSARSVSTAIHLGDFSEMFCAPAVWRAEVLLCCPRRQSRCSLQIHDFSWQRYVCTI